MEFIFPRYLNWRVPVTDADPAYRFGKQTRKRITKSIEILVSAGYSFIFEPVTESYLGKFIPLYENFITSKERGTIFPVRDRVDQGLKNGKKFIALSLYKNSTYLGGLILSHHHDHSESLSVNYKVLPHSLEEKIPISTSFVAELYLHTYAFEQGFSLITHGIDRNIYGYYSNIGLAAFKTQIGCRPWIPAIRASTGEPNQILEVLPVFEEDMLLFLGSTHKDFSTKAIFVSEKPEDELKTKFPILFSNKYYTTRIARHEEIPSLADWK